MRVAGALPPWPDSSGCDAFLRRFLRRVMRCGGGRYAAFYVWERPGRRCCAMHRPRLLPFRQARGDSGGAEETPGHSAARSACFSLFCVRLSGVVFFRLHRRVFFPVLRAHRKETPRAVHAEMPPEEFWRPCRPCVRGFCFSPRRGGARASGRGAGSGCVPPGLPLLVCA